jgi:hypothetical protein
MEKEISRWFSPSADPTLHTRPRTYPTASCEKAGKEGIAPPQCQAELNPEELRTKGMWYSLAHTPGAADAFVLAASMWYSLAHTPGAADAFVLAASMWYSLAHTPGAADAAAAAFS